MKQQSLSICIEDVELLPFYASTLAAGADIRSSSKDPILLNPQATAVVPTGIRMEIPPGFEVQIRPRSGLAFRNQVTVLNAPGTIDADYRGEVKILLINHGKEPLEITYGMRIAQMVLAEVVRAEFKVTDGQLASTGRGEGGFGHTGTH